MKERNHLWLAAFVVLLLAGTLRAQFTGDVLGAHDLSPGGQSPIKGGALCFRFVLSSLGSAGDSTTSGTFTLTALPLSSVNVQLEF